MSINEETLKWYIASLRRDITADWVALAKKTLDPEKRKALRDHLEMSNCALRSAIDQLNTRLPKAGKSRRRVSEVDLNAFAR